MKKYIVIQEPLSKYRATYVTTIVVVEGLSKRDAVKIAESFVEYLGRNEHFKKPYALELVENKAYLL